MSVFTVSGFFRFFAVCIVGFASAAHLARAEKADRDKPINISAERADANDQGKRTTFSGSVLVTKGTIVLRAEQIDLAEDVQGHQSLRAVAKKGQYAFFRQKREGFNEFVEGEAQTIVYDEKTAMTTLMGNAVMRRLRGSTLVDESSAASIAYDNSSEVLSMQGQTAPQLPVGGAASQTVSTSGWGGQPQGRVRMMISPKTSAQGATAPAALPAQTPVLKAESAIQANGQ